MFVIRLRAIVLVVAAVVRVEGTTNYIAHADVVNVDVLVHAIPGVKRAPDELSLR